MFAGPLHGYAETPTASVELATRDLEPGDVNSGTEVQTQVNGVEATPAREAYDSVMYICTPAAMAGKASCGPSTTIRRA